MKKLIETIKTMFKSYRKLNHYLLGIENIKDISFKKYLYVGSVRSLEVTYKNDSYHPHLQVAIFFELKFLIEKIFFFHFSWS